MTQSHHHLGEHFFLAPARRNLKKDSFGERYMLLGPFIFAGLHVFTMSAVLGYARRDKLDTLMQLLPPIQFRPDANAASSKPAHFEWMVSQGLQRMGREPTTLLDYWAHTHYPAVAPENLGDPKTQRDLVKEKVKLSRALHEVTWYEGEGLAFGANRPQLFERLYAEQFERRIEQDEWDSARAAGPDIPTQQDVIPLTEMREEFYGRSLSSHRVSSRSSSMRSISDPNGSSHSGSFSAEPTSAKLMVALDTGGSLIHYAQRPMGILVISGG
jgi:hypothetical protein